MPNVKVSISPNGSKVKVGVEGMQGQSCTSLSEGLEKAIFGNGEVDRHLTDEYYMEPGVNVEESI